MKFIKCIFLLLFVSTSSCRERFAGDILVKKFSANLFLVSWTKFQHNNVNPLGIVAYNEKKTKGLFVIGGNVTLVDLKHPYLFGKKEAFKSPFPDDSVHTRHWKTSGFFIIDIRQFEKFEWRGLDMPSIQWFSKEVDLKSAIQRLNLDS